ncbi:carbamoyltransferase [Mycobacterium sp. 852002-51152_SCH6134967]|uniref:carbamoyltransferase family protein n=1 Tax=Mycobacterium sp. 852002-51152_SCH6134967 TaxID=1834096 RepID=UPI000AC25053|nr:carbamoyltransferase [Mycobacterium sp. 852002-51152_SCH6134967]
MNILGISAFYHDSAAALVRDGQIIAAAQEERFTRLKHDPGFPKYSIEYCLAAGGVDRTGIDAIAFYEKPISRFIRLLKTYAAIAPRGFRSFSTALPQWLGTKLWITYEIERNLKALGYRMPSDLYFTEHHESHAASAFYPSPFESAAVLTMDGVGEWATASIGRGVNNQLEIHREMRFPHSVGLLYSAFTYFCGFRVNSGEYKLMGLAPYGEPAYVDVITDNLVDINADGSIQLNLRYFDFLGGLTMTNDRFAELFGGPPRPPESEITRREMDIARSIQDVTEEIVMRMAATTAAITQEKNLCLAGGVALNSVANGRLLREGPFTDIWIQPAAGDAGGSVGAALHTWYQIAGNPRHVAGDRMQGAYLGPQFSADDISAYLSSHGYPFQTVTDTDERARRIAELVAEGNVVGLFTGRMEFGPRALGNRSILGDARSPQMQSVMNLKIKYRESFRPFAPSVLEERAKDYFDLDAPSPYMLLVSPVREEIRTAPSKAGSGEIWSEVNKVRSSIPAVTHVDYSARIQTVSRETNPFYHNVLASFEDLTGCPVVVNTSFNVRGEPIVCTPQDAYRCFMNTEMDYLILEDHVLDKRLQPGREDRELFHIATVLD